MRGCEITTIYYHMCVLGKVSLTLKISTSDDYKMWDMCGIEDLL